MLPSTNPFELTSLTPFLSLLFESFTGPVLGTDAVKHRSSVHVVIDTLLCWHEALSNVNPVSAAVMGYTEAIDPIHYITETVRFQSLTCDNEMVIPIFLSACWNQKYFFQIGRG